MEVEEALSFEDETGHPKVLQEHDSEEKVSEDLHERQRHQGRGEDGDVLRFLDSLDTYLVLMDSLHSNLRQGWLNLASARHSMGISRVNSALLDHNYHSAATSLQVTHKDADSMGMQAHFTLRKWASSKDGNYNSETKSEGKLNQSGLRHRDDKSSLKGETLPVADDRVKKGRSKSLSVFGTLVSPNLRAAQSSFEKALETLIEIANARSSMLSAFDQVQTEREVAET